MIRFKEVEAKSVLVKSKLPDTDYVINLYTGCAIGCQYCYASFMGRFANEPIEDWGNYVYAKTNAIEVLRGELEKLSSPRNSQEKQKTIFISSVTDPYQPIESKYELTRQALQLLIEYKWMGCVGILTKSILVTRDIDLFKQIPDIEVGMTITTTDDSLARFLEPRTSVTTERLKALKTLTDAGIRTYAFVGPLLPHFRHSPELLDNLFAQLAKTGVKEIYAEHINMKRYIMGRLGPAIAKLPAEAQKIYAQAKTKEHKTALDEIVLGLVKKYNLTLRLGKVIDHGS
jgi:DNA repair photolyase